MIPFKSPVGNFRIPTTYTDLRAKDVLFMQMNARNITEVMKYLTGLNEIQLAMLDLSPIDQCFEFLKEPILDTVEPIDIIKIKKKVYQLPEDISMLEWGQKLLAVDAINNNDPLTILSTYLQPIVDNSKFDDERIPAINDMISELRSDLVYGPIKYIIQQLNQLLENEKKKLTPNITPEQRQAGIDQFNVFGDFNNIKFICSEYGITPDEAVKMDYNTVFITLWHSKISINFDRRLSQILSRKANRKSGKK